MTEDEEYTKGVNKTYSKVFSKNQFIPKILAKHIPKKATILDFGAGQDAFGTQALRAQGYQHVTAFEIGKNFNPELHDAMALHRTYDCVFASNVINVQPSKTMVHTILRTCKNCMKKPGGVFIFNFPASPRKSSYTVKELDEVLNKFFTRKTRIATDPPTWMCSQ